MVGGRPLPHQSITPMWMRKAWSASLWPGTTGSPPPRLWTSSRPFCLTWSLQGRTGRPSKGRLRRSTGRWISSSINIFNKLSTLQPTFSNFDKVLHSHVWHLSFRLVCQGCLPMFYREFCDILTNTENSVGRPHWSPKMRMFVKIIFYKVWLKSQQMVLLIVVIENVRLRACTKTGTIQFLSETYPILM